MARLQLQYSPEFNKYTLRDPYTTRDDESFEMVIDHFIKGTYQFHFLIWEDGDWRELITKADYDGRVQDIKDHETDEIAALWVEHQVGYEVVRDDHPVFKLRDKWLAFQELNLFDVPVNYDSWRGKPLPMEAIEKMAEARDKWIHENAGDF
jgi:hypothetical protein